MLELTPTLTVNPVAKRAELSGDMKEPGREYAKAWVTKLHDEYDWLIRREIDRQIRSSSAGPRVELDDVRSEIYFRQYRLMLNGRTVIGSEKKWIRTSVRNTFLDFVRRAELRHTVLGDEPDRGDHSTTEPPHDPEDLEALRQLIAELSMEQQSVLRHVFHLELAPAEIAERLGLPAVRVYQLKSGALRRLERRMKVIGLDKKFGRSRDRIEGENND